MMPSKLHIAVYNIYPFTPQRRAAPQRAGPQTVLSLSSHSELLPFNRRNADRGRHQNGSKMDRNGLHHTILIFMYELLKCTQNKTKRLCRSSDRSHPYEMPAAVVCNLHNTALLLFLLILFGTTALQKQIRTVTVADDRSSNNDNDVIDMRLNNYTVENEEAGESLSSLQNLSHGAFVQCRKDWPSRLNASTFWDRQCYLNMTKSVRFYHLGKGGGGTIFFSLVDNGIVVQRDHPRPIHGIEQILNGPVSTLLINIRDPVDRFVSAFNWRSLLFCQRDGENRKKYPSEIDEKDRRRYQPHLRPQETCFDESLYPKQIEIIQRLYNDDVNKMAESLCEESNNVEQAVQHTKLISHAKLSLAEWLRPLLLDTDTNTTSLIKPKGLSSFMAITLEQQSPHNSSLLQHTYEAVHQLYFDHGVDERTLDSLLRHKPIRIKRVSEIMTHSSNKTGTGKVLGAIGECCLARFLEEDYRLIQYMIGDVNPSKDVGALDPVHTIIREACKWGSLKRRELCRADLQSMLHRRAKFLDRSLGTCRDVVSL
eukprot:scaffold5835_cov144-Skeletonema_menzelii.AAC.6